MDDKKGEVYFRDIHGNFHKLETNDLNDEILELTSFDNILSSSKTEKLICNYKPFNYYKFILKNIKNGIIKNNRIILNKGLYKFSVYLTITSLISQRIYFFFRDNMIIKNTLKTESLSSKIPNNFNINFIIDIKNNNEELEIAVISEKDIDNISSYILYTKLN